MASIKQSPAINYPQLGQLGFRMPQSEPQPQLDWHNDPFAIQFRKFVIKSIEIYLAQNAPPNYGPEIVVLAAELEDLLFKSAIHKEDYMDQGKLYNRLRCLVHSKWLRTKKSEEANDNVTSLPTYAAPQRFGMRNGHGANRKKSLSEQIMTASTGIKSSCADNLKQPLCVTDVPGSLFLEPQKGACEVPLPEPMQVLPSKCFPGEGCPSREAVDSGPSFSGSVLQYDSEASFESHHVNAGCSTEGDLNPMMTSSQNSPSVHTPSTAIEDTKLEFCSQSADIRQPVAEPLQFEQRSHELMQLKGLHMQKCIGGSCSCKNNSCPAQRCSIYGPVASLCTEGGGQSGFCSTARNDFDLMTSTNDCGNEVSLERSDDTMNPSKRRKLEPVRRSSSSIGQQQPDSPLVVNSDNIGANKKVISVAADNLLTLDELGGSSLQYPSAALKHVESELATHDGLKDLVADTCCTGPSEYAPNLSNINHTAESEKVTTGKDIVETKPEHCSQLTSTRTEKQKVDGISLTEFFTLAEIGQHISSLRQKVDQCTLEEVKGKGASFLSENYCQLCAMDKLAFPPMPIYCSACSSRIKNYSTYYSTRDENRAQTCFCSACYNKARGGVITCCGMLSVRKVDLVMKKNNLVTEESWVQCDQCEGWQHQICALFNDKRDLGGKAEYVCPKCYMKDLEAGIRVPLPRSAAFDAVNLPQTKLSNHIEKRLDRRLKQEREDRAKVAGSILQEVPEAADLVVRVVSSIDKIVKVKQEFLNLFPEKNYPSEFPYKSKVILLFQRIEGVDVCLFAMYVQEYGSECHQPNQRCVYISYLDSVKYFRPEIKTLDGNALRTFVYHEILIGYMEYCKKRGFAMCYIWACPPVKGEDYILYCHPDTQKTPKTDKLRTWYQGMLKKATKENVVVSYTNFYEKYFVPTKEDNKITAARLPSFEGDYWSSVAETVIKKFGQQDMQSKAKKMTKRSMKAMGYINPTADDLKDMLLMQELAQTMSPTKDDFIIAYLQPVCTHCHEVILSGKRWFCSLCKNYQSCERCHDLNLNSEQGHTHISSNGQRHALTEETIDYVPADTDDHDTQIGNCFLEIRQNLLSFCQGNHYQFDTLRRAKHSSSMILFHLHRPNESNVGTSCSLCLKDIGNDPQWKCEICPEFSVCGLCYYRNNVGCHIHALVRALPTASREKERDSAEIVRELLDVILHASRCQTTAKLPCPYPNCILIRRLFAHAHLCTVRVTGGCRHCKKTWFALMMHSRRCEDMNCGVPRCMDLKKYAERLESRCTSQLMLEGNSEPGMAVN